MILDERSPHEPTEDHEPPEPDIGPPIPDVEPEFDGFLGPPDTPTDLLKAFWSLVLLFNLGLFATSLGLMFIVFRAEWYLGGGLLLVGILALVRGIYRYRRIDPHALGEDPGHEVNGDDD